VHDADALFFANLALAYREGGLPLFTELLRRRVFSETPDPKRLGWIY
jgi:hypothetical protein